MYLEVQSEGLVPGMGPPLTAAEVECCALHLQGVAPEQEMQPTATIMVAGSSCIRCCGSIHLARLSQSQRPAAAAAAMNAVVTAAGYLLQMALICKMQLQQQQRVWSLTAAVAASGKLLLLLQVLAVVGWQQQLLLLMALRMSVWG